MSIGPPAAMLPPVNANTSVEVATGALVKLGKTQVNGIMEDSPPPVSTPAATVVAQTSVKRMTLSELMQRSLGKPVVEDVAVVEDVVDAPRPRVGSVVLLAAGAGGPAPPSQSSLAARALKGM
jgi:hypothetical protein